MVRGKEHIRKLTKYFFDFYGFFVPFVPFWTFWTFAWQDTCNQKVKKVKKGQMCLQKVHEKSIKLV